MQEVFGEAGRHARSAVGVAVLPLGVAVEVDAIVAVGPSAQPHRPILRRDGRPRTRHRRRDRARRSAIDAGDEWDALAAAATRSSATLS